MNFLDLPLDIPTLTLGRALVQVILAGLLIYVGSRQQGDQAARYWAMGLLLNGLALLFFILPDPPGWGRVITACNHLAFGASSAFFLIGFWRFSRQASQRWLLALMIVIPILGLLAWEVILPNARLRILSSAFGQALFLFALQHTLQRHPRIEITAIYRRLRIIVIVYLMIFVWSYTSIAGILPTSANVDSTYHRALFSIASLIFMLALAVTCLALQFALLAARETDRAMTDWLTGLLNRRGFFHALHEVQESHQKRKDGLSVIVIDIDHFKSVNDRFGHAGGDRVLTALAALLREQTSDQDLVARTGGEEFCIVMPAANPQSAAVLAEAIRAACADIKLAALDGRLIPFTISAGVCEMASGVSFEDAMSRADKALYVAKREGRNQVQHSADHALRGQPVRA